MKLGRRRNDHKGRTIRHYANQPEIFMNLRIAFVSSSSAGAASPQVASGGPVKQFRWWRAPTPRHQPQPAWIESSQFETQRRVVIRQFIRSHVAACPQPPRHNIPFIYYFSLTLETHSLLYTGAHQSIKNLRPFRRILKAENLNIF